MNLYFLLFLYSIFTLRIVINLEFWYGASFIFFKLQSSCPNTIYLQAIIFPVMLEESYFYHNRNFHLHLSLLGEFLFSLIYLSVHALSSTIPRTNIKDMGQNWPWNWRLSVLKTIKMMPVRPSHDQFQDDCQSWLCCFCMEPPPSVYKSSYPLLLVGRG